MASERGSERGGRTLARALHRSSVLNWDTELAFGSKRVHEHTLQPTRVVKPFETLNRNETVGYRFEERNGYGVMASVSNNSLHGFRDTAVWNVIKRRWRTRIGTLQGSVHETGGLPFSSSGNNSAISVSVCFAFFFFNLLIRFDGFK